MAAFNELIEYMLFGPADQQVDAKFIDLNVVILDEPRLNPEHNTFSTNFRKFVAENSWTKPANNPHFFTYFFIGSVLSLPYSNILEKYGIGKFLLKVGEDGVLKFVYYSTTNGFLRLCFRAVSITDEEVDEVTDVSNYAFTDVELADIIYHFQIYPYSIEQLAFDFKIFKTFKSLQMEENFSSLWAIVYPEQLVTDLIRVCNSVQSTALSSGFMNILPFNGMEKKFFMEPLHAMSGQLVSPESMSALVRTLISNARILYHTFSDNIGALNSVVEFSGFAAGILSLNFRTTYSMKVLIGASLEYTMDIYFKPEALLDYDVRLLTPCQIFFVNSDQMDQSFLEWNIKKFSRMEYVPHISTDRKYSIMTVADLNRIKTFDAVRSMVLPLNAPVVHKLLDAANLIDRASLEYSANIIRNEINVIIGKLASTNEDILFNYLVGQLVTAKPRSGSIRLNLLFTFADHQLNGQVKSVITICNGRMVFINVIKNANLASTQQFITDQTRRMINEQAELHNVVHIDIVPTAGQVHITIPTFNEQGRSYIGTVHSIGDIDVEDIITQIKDENLHMVDELLSYALKDLRPHLTNPQMMLAFLKGLFSKKYTILHSPSLTNRLILLEDGRSAAISSQMIQEWLFVIHYTETVADHTVPVIIFSPKVSDEGHYSVQPTMFLDFFVDHLMLHGQFIKVSAPLIELHIEENLPSCSTKIKRDFSKQCAIPDEKTADVFDDFQQGKVSSEKVRTFVRGQSPQKVKKLFNFLNSNQMKLAGHVIGLYATDVVQIMEKMKVLQTLSTLAKYSNHLTLGVIYKNMAVDLYNGNYAGVAFSTVFLATSYGVPKAVDTLSKSVTLMSGNSHLSRLFRTSRPFLRRFASAFNLYTFYSSLKSYLVNKDTISTVSLAESGTFLFVDAVAIGLEFAGPGVALSIFEPAGALIAGFVFVAAESYLIHEKLKTYDELLHLGFGDKFLNGLYTFFTGDVEPILRDMANEKMMNNEMARLASEFMSQNSLVAVYASPSYITLADGIRICDDNVMLFDQKIRTIWADTKPDEDLLPSDKNLLCFTSKGSKLDELESEKTFLDKVKDKLDAFFWPQEKTASATTFTESYFCDDSMALSRKVALRDSVAWIDMKNGNDIIHGFPHLEHIFIIGDGYKTIRANNRENILIFNSNDTKGYIELHGKGSLADFSAYGINTNDIMNFIMQGTNLNVQDSKLNIIRISRIKGRKMYPDKFVASCYSSYFDGKSGTSSKADYIFIPDEFCYYNFAVVVRSFTSIVNSATFGSFKYFIKNDIGRADINIENGVGSIHEIILQNVTMISLTSLNFNHEKQCLNITRKKTASDKMIINICNIKWVNTRLHFSDGFTLLLTEDGYMHAFATFVDNPNFLINEYSTHAKRLNIEMNMRSSHDNSSIVISCKKEHLKSKFNTTDYHIATILENNPNQISHLVGGSIENIFILDVNETLINENQIFPIHIHVRDRDILKNVIDLSRLLRFYNESSILKLNVHYTVKDKDGNLIIELFKIDSIFCRILLLDGAKLALMKTFSIILRNPMFVRRVVKNSEYFILVPEPIRIDPQDSHSDITVIEKNHMENGLSIRVESCYGSHEIFLHGENMIFSLNIKDESSNTRNIFIIFRSFYGGAANEISNFSIEFSKCEQKKLDFTEEDTKIGVYTNLDNRIKMMESDVESKIKVLIL